MNNLTKNIISLLVGALIGLAVMWVVWPESTDQQIPNKTPDWSRWSDRAIEEKIEDASLEEVEGFVKSEMETELPADYVISAQIANAASPGAAVKQINREYAVFSTAKGDDLLLEVQQNPLKYREYLRAHKAVKKRFNKE